MRTPPPNPNQAPAPHPGVGGRLFPARPPSPSSPFPPSVSSSLRLSVSSDLRLSVSSSPAFTLIELLVSIAIIAVLIAIVLPSIGAARDSARRVQCLANLRSMQMGLTMYLDQESKGLLPEVLPIVDPGDAVDGEWVNKNDPSLLAILGNYIDAPLPRRDPNDPAPPEQRRWIAEHPYRCPMDRVSDDAESGNAAVHESFGTSYAYYPGLAMLVLEFTGAASAGELSRPVTRVWNGFVDSRKRAIDLPVLHDAADWHPRGDGAPRLASYLDGRADWIPANLNDEIFQDVITQAARYAGLRP